MNFKYDYPRRHAITVEEFMRMEEAHVFGYEARLELIEGEIFEMMPISSAHASIVYRLNTLLRSVAPGAIVSVQNPLVLSERSMPTPDVMLLRARADRYYSSHPVAADTLLVVELAGPTLEYDVKVKRQVYAAGEVTEVWVVDIDRRELHVFRQPEPDYSIHRVLTAREDIAVALPGSTIFAVSALFPDPQWRDEL